MVSGKILILLFLLLVVARAEVLVLSSERNEGSFGVARLKEGFCFVGREDTPEEGYDLLLGVCDRKCRVFRVGTGGEDYSYSVVGLGDRCLAGIVTTAFGGMDMGLVEFGQKGVKGVRLLGGEGGDMLWYLRKVKDGFLAVGGVREKEWDILVIKLDESLSPVWVRRLGTEGDEYAYGVVEWRGEYYVVGRSNFRGNWDAFVIVLSREGKLKRANLFGSERKDYLRYVGIFGGEPLAVGRSEAKGDSDVLIFSPRSGLYKLYDGGEEDYGRVFEERDGGLVLMGDTYREGVSDGMVIFLDRALKVERALSVGGDDVESIRYLSDGLLAGYTYSFTLDNDVMVGELGESCRSFVRRKEFKERKAHLKIHPYPVKVRRYELKPVSYKFRVEEVSLKVIKPCQE